MNGEPDAGATADALNAEAVGRGWRREIFRRPLRETMVVGEKWVNGSGNIKRLWRAGPVVLYGTGGCPPALDAGHSGQPLTSPSESKLRMIYQD